MSKNCHDPVRHRNSERNPRPVRGSQWVTIWPAGRQKTWPEP